MKICNVVGARPNFMKIAPIVREIKKDSEISQILVHTGQHYNAELNDVFFRELKIPIPDEHLNVGSLPRLEQIQAIKEKFYKTLLKHKPNVVLVVGDVNSTIAAASTAKELNIKVAHVEAGLRSFDLTMPEELNRIETDAISDFLYLTEESALKNLTNEDIKGFPLLVGNVMIDTLYFHLAETESSFIQKKLYLTPRKFFVGTFYRPSNVDNLDSLKDLIEKIKLITSYLPLVLPLHPRTKNGIEKNNLSNKLSEIKNLHLVPPLGYIEFIALIKKSAGVITDSGGVQEETTALKIPCLTLRTSTEHPSTISIGANTLIGQNTLLLKSELEKIISGTYKEGNVPPYWDGHAAERIIKHLKGKLE